MNKIEQFLKNYIEHVPKYSPSKEDKKIIQFEGIEEFIFRKLQSSKYRSSSTTKDYIETIRTNIHYCVENKIPIHISLPFGAYKNWRMPTYPGIDWAEVFNIIYLREYLSPLAAAYEFGVIMDYFSVELFVSKTDNMPQKDIDKYNEQFINLVKFFQKHLPPNLKLKYTNLREQISQKKALERVEKKVQELRSAWKDVDKKTKEYKLKRAERNCVIPKGTKKKEAEKLLLDSVFHHDAFSSECWADKSTPWAFDKDMVTLGHSYTEDWAIHVRSSRASTINFWIGMGALIDKEDEFLPTILSYSQYKEQQRKIQSKKINLLNLGKISINLNSIPLIKA